MSNLIEILHRVSNQLSEMINETQIYEVMNEGIKEVLPDAYCIITKLQPDEMNFRLIHSFGLEKFIPAVKILLGKDPFQLDFPFSDLSEFKQGEFETRKLYHFSNGIYDLVNGKFSKPICRAIEKILGISKIYAISLVIEDKYFGGAIILIPKSSINCEYLSQDKILAIETIAAQVSLVINKLRDIDALKKKDEELVVSQSKFNQLVNQLNDVVWKANGDGSNVIDLNNSFEKFYGYASSEFDKNPLLFQEIIHPEDKDIYKNANDELLAHGKATCEYRIIKPDGSLMWIRERNSIVYDIDGKAIQRGGIATDITEKKLLEEQLLLKNYALDNSANAIGMADLKGNTIYVNNAFVKLWGFKNKTEIIGVHFSEFSTKEKTAQEAYETNMRGEVFISEDEAVRRDGNTINYIVSASMVMHLQKPLCLMAVFTDITERKLQENIQKENEEKLIKLNNDKDKFFSIISHDLRSPFNGMMGLLDIMVDDYDDFTDEERLKMIQSSHSSAVKAYNLLTDLLSWARLQTNKIEIEKETIKLAEILNTNISLFISDAEKKEISILNKVDQNIQLKLDVNSLTTIIRNLLVNAIKFTPDGGLIEFDIKQMQNGVELSIKDSGVGMSEDTINKLFRLEESISLPGTNNEKGTGLGLTICNDLVALNGWKMNIESQLGKGSVFRILIPQ